MKKQLSAATALLLSAALVLTACGGSTASSSQAASSSASDAASEPASEATSETTGELSFVDAPTLNFTFADNNSSNSDVGKQLAALCDTIAEATEGTVNFEYYGDALLGDEATVVGMLENGTVDMSRVNLAAVQATVPELGVLTMPYIYKDGEHCVRVLESDVGEELLGLLGDHGMVGLGYMSSPAARGFYSASPIRTVDDLKGKLIRVQESDVVINMVEALGGVATPMAYAEVYQALQTGVVDVAENDPNSYYLSGHYEIAPYFTYDNHQISPGMFVMSQNAWEQMTPAQQETVRDCIQEFVTEFRDGLAAQLETNRKLCEEAGCEFIEVDTTEWREACQAMYSKYPQYSEYLERILAID